MPSKKTKSESRVSKDILTAKKGSPAVDEATRSTIGITFLTIGMPQSLIGITERTIGITMKTFGIATKRRENTFTMVSKSILREATAERPPGELDDQPPMLERRSATTGSHFTPHRLDGDVETLRTAG